MLNAGENVKKQKGSTFSASGFLATDGPVSVDLVLDVVRELGIRKLDGTKWCLLSSVGAPGMK